MSDRRDQKLTDLGCTTSRNQLAAARQLDLAERCPVVLSRGQRDVIRKALRNLAVGPSLGQSGVTHAERVAAREMIDREFKGELYCMYGSARQPWCSVCRSEALLRP